ncbi:hypothetical protein R6Q57_013731 [Mikania cordata]
MKKIRGATIVNLIGILKYSPFSWTTLVAAVFVFVSLTLSIFLLFQHLSAYKNPEEQKFLFGIVLMVPSYAVESFVSLLNPSISLEIEILRDCYEAFAMYCFGRYLIACLGGEKRAINFMEREGRAGQRSPLLDQTSEKGIIKHIFPMNLFLQPWKLGHRVYQIMKAGIVQYMIIKAVTSVLAVFLEAFDVYCEGDFDWGCGLEQMGIASMVHLYVFPSEPYKLMGDLYTGDFSVLGDYASSDCPLDPDEVRDSERRTKLRLPRPDDDVKIKTAIRESVRDVFVGGGEYIVSDLRFTMNQAVVPVEKGITKFNERLHKISKNIKKTDKNIGTRDDSCITKRRVIRGIDDPLLNGCFSDSGDMKKKGHRRSYTSGGESITDQSLKFGRYEVRGSRWVTKE